MNLKTYQCHCPDADCECCVKCREGKDIIDPSSEPRNYEDFCSDTCPYKSTRRVLEKNKKLIKELKPFIKSIHSSRYVSQS